MQHLFNVPDRVSASMNDYFKKAIEGSKDNTAPKFNWCVASKWSSLNDEDMAIFYKMKKIRDSMSHGTVYEDHDLPIYEAKQLAIKILQELQEYIIEPINREH
ncbi:hypothetical protein [Vibrio algarum]|uniref:MAE-28990/MAE-18760-like HEPN domain-containing protein n=1 Tax=Vibrio algarum TaxID=3020714 RepID=A0ABT4YVS4_9VIBR|nr:hypothetical protein [Vibrio sp. KJ40-1]MDB1125475.1 hypothetical protein [Vibrio sp. KJ40-1]